MPDGKDDKSSGSSSSQQEKPEGSTTQTGQQISNFATLALETQAITRKIRTKIKVGVRTDCIIWAVDID